MILAKKLVMKRCAVLVSILLFLGSCAINKKEQVSRLSKKICSGVLRSNADDDAFDQVFSQSFEQLITKSQFKKMMKGIVDQYGECRKVTHKTEQGIITILTERGNHLTFEMRIDNSMKKLVGLFFHGVKNELNRFRDKAEWICKKLITKNPAFVYKNHFTKNFRNAIPYRKLIGISSNLYKQFGGCNNIEIPQNAFLKEFYTIQKNGKKLIFNLVVEKESEQSLISGLLFRGEKTKLIKFGSKTEIMAELKKFDGLMSTLLIEDGNKILNYKSDKTHAIGSISKLYVLAALASKIENKELQWTNEYPVKNRLKSLPSGVMQNYKQGKMVKLYDMASKMISMSDNTATDHLIEIIGRKNIENYISKQNLISNKDHFTPFLKTKELFAIRAYFKKKDYQNYVKLSRKERLNKIKKVAKYNQKKIIGKLTNWDQPRNISEIEWYATPQEVCKLNFLIHRFQDPKVKKIMALNAPFAQGNKSFTYTGYKGGSEPGVLQMSYLLQKNDKKWSCLFIGQNNPTKNINHSKVFQLAQSILSWFGEK